MNLTKTISNLGFESQKKFAEFIGVDSRTVNRWCRGYSQVPHYILLLCDSLEEKYQLQKEIEVLDYVINKLKKIKHSN